MSSGDGGSKLAASITKKIPDGALIEVDGTTGVVTVVEAP